MTEVQKQRTSKSSSGDGDDSALKKIINKELEGLFKTGQPTLTRSDLLNLRTKYRDNQEIPDRIAEAYAKQLRIIRKNAKEFADHIIEHYGSKRFTEDKVLKKAIKLKAKLGWNDAFFREFQRLYHIYLTGNIPKAYRPTRTAIGKVLGSIPSDIVDEPRLNISDKEHQVVNKFLETYEKMKPLWLQLLNQTIAYNESLPLEVVLAKFDPKVDNALTHVHPIIVALFGPKIPYLEEVFLYANLGYIIKQRREGKPINTRPNAELLNNISNDPMDTVCSIESPMADLYTRYAMQLKVWESVYKLRSGQVYGPELKDFLIKVDDCRLSAYDMPDLLTAQDVGAAFRRLCSALSLRPTTVLTSPIQNGFGMSGFGPMPYENTMTLPKRRKIPMVTLRLPYKQMAGPSEIQLEDSMKQEQWFLEDNKHLVYKAKTVIDSDSVLFFYVNRLNTLSHLAASENLMGLPLTIGGIDDINDLPIKFRTNISFGNDNFNLCSVIASEVVELESGASLVTGSITLLVKEGQGGNSDSFIRYDPVTPRHIISSTNRRSDPFTDIPRYPDGTDVQSFEEIASTRGIIFVYQKQL